MNSAKTKGIVLKRMNYGEADRILTILTERFGKIKAIAKGVRKTKSKLAGHLEPFMIIDLELHEGKTFFIVTGAAIKEEFKGLSEDLKKVSQAFYLGELVDKFVPEGQKTEVFSLFCQALKDLKAGENSVSLRIFELKIIESGGFHPELYECVHCKKILLPGNNFWDSVEGGVLCKGCHASTKHGKSISDDLIKLLRLIEKSGFSVIGRLKISFALENEAEKVLSEYINSILEREIKSKKFMKMVLN